METGEKELRKAFEDVTIKNVNTVVSYSNDTRKMVKELENKIQKLQNNLSMTNDKLEELHKQFAMIIQQLSRGGTSNGFDSGLGN